MYLTDKTGDLFNTDSPALAHGVNCAGAMGAGIAVQFRTRYPLMHHAYKDLCRAGGLRAGDVFPWQDEQTGRWIYNMATQVRPGRRGATLDAVDKAAHAMVIHAAQHAVPVVALPEVGCGIGGLAWEDVAPVLEGHAAGSGVRIEAWHLPKGHQKSWFRRNH